MLTTIFKTGTTNELNDTLYAIRNNAFKKEVFKHMPWC